MEKLAYIDNYKIAQMTPEDFYAYQNYRDKNFDNIFPPAIEPLEALSIITDIVLDGELIVDQISNKQIWTLIICRLLTLHRNKWFKLGRRLNLF